MKCANCAKTIPDGWRGSRNVGRNVCCSKLCAEEYAPAEVARLEKWLKTIVVKTRGMAKDLAANALYSNQDPT